MIDNSYVPFVYNTYGSVHDIKPLPLDITTDAWKFTGDVDLFWVNKRVASAALKTKLGIKDWDLFSLILTNLSEQPF